MSQTMDGYPGDARNDHDLSRLEDGAGIAATLRHIVNTIRDMRRGVTANADAIAELRQWTADVEEKTNDVRHEVGAIRCGLRAAAVELGDQPTGNWATGRRSSLN